MRELARSYTPEALEVLVNIMRSAEDAGARQRAADSLLDRGWGKASSAAVLLESKQRTSGVSLAREGVTAEILAEAQAILTGNDPAAPFD
jgi:hypothetical protein